MFLSDSTLKQLIKDSAIEISPPVEEKNIRPNGIRVHLDDTLIEYESQVIDPTEGENTKYKEISLKSNSYTLKPGKFILGSTIESIKTPRDFVGFLDGRSTLARLGLMIHMTAAITDGLYEDARKITLEIYNAGNMEVVLSNKLAIGSLAFAKLDKPVQQKVQDQYKGQSKVVASNLSGQFS